MEARAASLLKFLNRIESVAAATAYALVAVLLISDVVGRELFGHGVFGAQKMAVFGSVVAGFLGLSLATAANTQLRPAFLDGVFKGKTFDRAGDFVAFAFFLFMAVMGAKFVMQSYEYADRAAVLYWLLWPIQLIIPYALLSTGVRHLLFGLCPDLKPVVAAGEGE